MDFGFESRCALANFKAKEKLKIKKINILKVVHVCKTQGSQVNLNGSGTFVIKIYLMKCK